MKAGDKVNYSGILSGQPPLYDCIIIRIEKAGDIFNQDMAVLDKGSGWVSLRELTLVKKDGE